MPPVRFKRSRALWDEARRPGAPKMAVARAILYELQPFRLSSVDTKALRQRCYDTKDFIFRFTTKSVPSATKETFGMVMGFSIRTWMIIAGVLAYYVALRLIHE